MGTSGTVREFPRKQSSPGSLPTRRPQCLDARKSYRRSPPARARGGPTLSPERPESHRAAELTVFLVVKHGPPRWGPRHGRAHPLLPLAPRKQGARLSAGIARVPGSRLARGGRLQGWGCVGARGAREAGGRRAGGRRGAAAPALRATPHRQAWVRAAAGDPGMARRPGGKGSGSCWRPPPFAPASALEGPGGRAGSSDCERAGAVPGRCRREGAGVQWSAGGGDGAGLARVDARGASYSPITSGGVGSAWILGLWHRLGCGGKSKGRKALVPCKYPGSPQRLESWGRGQLRRARRWRLEVPR